MGSTNRISDDAGWRDARVDESGQRRCRRCDKPVAKGRRNWCSEDCIHEHSIRSNPSYARRQVHLRDHGVCASCGLDTDALRAAEQACAAWRDGMRQAGRVRLVWDQSIGRSIAVPTEDQARAAEILRTVEARWTGDDYTTWEGRILLSIGLPWDRWHRPALWHMDHIVPVVEGGGECGLENLRTLCVPCHNRETAALARRRAERRRGQDALDLDGAA